MCSLFTIERTDLTRLFGVQRAAPVREGEQRPGMAVPVVRRHPESGERALDPLQWGLIPRWAKDPEMGGKLFNARLETARKKPSFREAFACRRCLVPACSWAEWQATGASRKQRWTLEMQDGGAFAFAGLWEGWQQPDGQWQRTCTILTMEARGDLAPIHQRMARKHGQPGCHRTAAPPRWLTWPGRRQRRRRSAPPLQAERSARLLRPAGLLDLAQIEAIGMLRGIDHQIAQIDLADLLRGCLR